MKRLCCLLCCLSAILVVSCTPKKPAVIAVTGITIDQTKATLIEGETLKLIPTIMPADATDPSIRWTSSYPTVATVDETGLVTAIKSGSTAITATTNDGGYTAICAVTVDIAISSTTGDASHISCRNAEIAGKANLPASAPAGLKFGILYTTESEVTYGAATAVEATMYDDTKRYTIVTGVLEPETKYYYRSYIAEGATVTYGDTKSFTTLAVSSMIKTEDATDIEAAVATLHAVLDLTDCKYDAIEYGFNLTPDGGSSTAIKADNLSNQAFSVKAEGLAHEKAYEVTAYVTLDGRTYTAEKKYFSTQPIQAGVVLNDATDITKFKATLSGKLNVESQGTFTKTATLYYSATATASDALVAQGTSISLTLNEADGTFSEPLTDLTPETAYHYAVVATVEGVSFTSEVKSFSTNEYPAVDMGLSVKWASSNVGVETPEDYGDYYAWGETETKSEYRWSTYKFATNSSGPFSKYNTDNTYGPVDNKTVLDPEDDVAHVKLGGSWRMPTDAEWAELRDTVVNCTWIWTTQNGVNGSLVTSKKTGNSIFLPATGYRSYYGVFSKDTNGCYWSSSLNTGYPNLAYGVYLGSGILDQSSSARCFGSAVRAVCD